MFGNPVLGRIAFPPAPLHPGQFEVTRTFAAHKILTPGGLGLDISNGRCSDPVLAMADGTVYERYIQNTPGMIGHGARIIRIRHSGGWTTGYAHLNTFSVGIGQSVKRGQRIGTLGQSGASSCHLHFDTQKNEVHYDPWLQLDQNIAPKDESVIREIYSPFPEGNRKWTANSTKEYTGWQSNGQTKKIKLTAGSNAPASGTATIVHYEDDGKTLKKPQPAPNGSGFVLIADGVLEGYYMLRTDGTVAPGTGNTFSKADVDRARKEGAASATKAAAEFTNTLPGGA
jgi:hypothetical protein